MFLSRPEGGQKLSWDNCVAQLRRTFAARAKLRVFHGGARKERGEKSGAGKSEPVASRDDHGESIRMRYGGARHLCKPPNV